MIRKYSWLLFTSIALFIYSCNAPVQDNAEPIISLKFEQSYTPTYSEIISLYTQLDEYYEDAKLIEVGTTDCGKPLHLFIIAEDGDFNPNSNREKGKTILLINNGIHPGEPCGIDASLMFADELLRNVDSLKQILKNTTICIVPVYNVGGHLNRSAYNRANQVGPAETGFRGNAKNLDLNRDFLKCDSENAKSFNRLFSNWKPDVFLDTHTTNGSDHQYAITLIPTNPASLPLPMNDFLRSEMLPYLYENMRETPYEMTPYVSWMNQNPGEGITMTMESARYSTGYSRVHHSYGFMTENHVYKSYPDRVLSVYHFMKVLAAFTSGNSNKIIQSRANAIHEAIESNLYALDYEVDTTQYELFNFKGYESGIYKSPVTGLDRFGYDRTKSFEREIKYFTTFLPSEIVEKPDYYIVPAAWSDVVERLKLNKVEMNTFPNDTVLVVEAYLLTNVSHAEAPYNGHYFHSKIELEPSNVQVQLFAGDYLISTKQEATSYIIECLEPRAKDSFFRWNFFDSMLDRREYFSSWGFEEKAQKYLDEHPEFKMQWEYECKNNPDLKGNHYQQMAYIYEQSDWAEKSYMRYPVYRLNNVELSWVQ